MGQISLNVNNQRYTIGCKDGEEERLKRLGELIDQRVRSLATKVGSVGETHLLLMGAIVLADELDEAQEGGPTSGGSDAFMNDLAAKLEDIAKTLQPN